MRTETPYASAARVSDCMLSGLVDATVTRILTIV